MLLERIVDTFEQTGQVNKKQLLLALKSSQSLNRQVNYLVESWKDPATQSGLFIELQEYAAAVQRNFEVTCWCRCNGTDHDVLPAVQHEVYMVTREAVYSAVRHGHAADIRIDLDEDQLGLDLRPPATTISYTPNHTSLLQLPAASRPEPASTE